MSTIAEDEDLAISENAHRRRRWRIEPNIRLGEILVLTTLIGGGTAAWFGVVAKADQNTRDIVTMQVNQRERDAQQDATVGRMETYLKDGVQQIRNEQAEIRREVGEISRYVRNRGG